MNDRLGYVVAEGRGAGDQVIRDTVAALQVLGVRMAGVVQVNLDTDPARKCDMDLHVLTGSQVIRISQNLGTLSRGCRLDPEGLERAVGLVASGLAQRPDLLVVNKFGKQELDGRGFCPLIGQALSDDIPVLTAVSPGNLEGFLAFSGDLGHRLPADPGAIADWVISGMRLAQAG